jgi:acetyl esterase/lipase
MARDDSAAPTPETNDLDVADDVIAEILRGVRAAPGPSVRQLGAEALRAGSRRRSAARPPGPALWRVTDLVVPADPPVPVRLYRPAPAPAALLVFIHGGGWTIGDLTSHDALCRTLARDADVAVLAVDHRRAPEAPWPAAVDDAVAVTRWALTHGPQVAGTDVVAVGGDSSGGNLAALACLRLRDDRSRLPAAQVLVYPNTDLTFSLPSVQEKATGWGLDADDARWFAEQWVPDPTLRADPRVSPLHEPDLTGLPPAIVVTAEHDPLRDEGEAYAARLAEAGVAVHARRERGLVHGFLGYAAASPAAAAATRRLTADIRDLLAP